MAQARDQVVVGENRLPDIIDAAAGGATTLARPLQGLQTLQNPWYHPSQGALSQPSVFQRNLVADAESMGGSSEDVLMSR